MAMRWPGRAVRRLDAALGPGGLRDASVLAAVFVISRVAAVLAGVAFETGPLQASIQNIDPALLRTHLLQSLWYLHGQPPLWNLLVGLSLKALPSAWPTFWHLAYMVMGFIQGQALLRLLRLLGAGRRTGLTVAALVTAFPATIAFENSFSYDYPTFVLATLVPLAAARFVQRPTFGRGLTSFSLAAALVLLRTLFQAWWIVAVVAIMLLACARHRRVVLVAAALPLALVAGVYAKNWLMYDVAGTTSWTGMGLARSVVVGLPLSERRALVAEGKLHRVSLVKPFSPLADYLAVGVTPARPTGIPILDEATGPEFPINMENKTFIAISRQYWQDDLWIVRHRPASYLGAIRRALGDFFSSATSGWEGHGNVARLGGYNRFVDEAAYGQLGLGRVGLFGVIAYLLAIGAGLVAIVRRLRQDASAAMVATAVALVTILNVVVVGNLAEVGENYRFRFVIDPLALALATVGARELLVRLRSQRRAV
ncbi:MAG: hypothetical protein WCH31_05980 [Actinomycetes bacterium]